MSLQFRVGGLYEIVLATFFGPVRDLLRPPFQSNEVS